MTLEQSTLDSMKELFKNKVCCKCGDKAARMQTGCAYRDGKRQSGATYYCHKCFPTGKVPENYRAIKTSVYKHPIFEKSLGS